MKTLFTKSKKGFTIIEVSLVIAIGGLIMLMVFIAFPAVQRNQRDSQRKNSDLSRLYTALTNYSTNNSGKLPEVPNQNNLTVIGVEDGTTTSTGKWATFYTNYLRANNDIFVDPAGVAYSLSIVNCNSTNGTSSAPNASLSTGEACKIAGAKSATNNTVTLGTDTGTLVSNAYSLQEGTIVIVVGAYCEDETARAATTNTGGTRKFAIMYGLEAGGVYCKSN